MCYLMTSRFEYEMERVLKLVQTFISKVGTALQPQQLNDFLLVVSEIRVSSQSYEAWEDCLGTFMQVIGAERFFQQLPLRLSEFDMNSLTYAQDSRSYLLQIARYKLKRADLRFFVENFVPLLKNLEAQR